MKTNKYKKFNFINENLICEDTEFFQYQFSQNNQSPLGPTAGFSCDPQLGIYTNQDSPYIDNYSRSIGMVVDLKAVIDYVFKNGSIDLMKYDFFVEDIEKYENLKILKINENESMLIDVYISFEFDSVEYFGVFKNFNKPYSKPSLQCELFKSIEYPYIDQEYRLKLSNYIRRVVNNWFIPKKGKYKNLKKDNRVKNENGQTLLLKKDTTIDVLNYDIDSNGNPFITIENNGNRLYIKDSNYFWFNWYFEKLK